MRPILFAVCCRAFAGLAMFVVAASAPAQPSMAVSTLPAAPTSASAVTIVVSDICCPVLQQTITRDGFVFVIPYEPACLSPCITYTATYPVGVLAPGTYTVRIIPSDGVGPSQTIGTFVVAAAIPPVPALGGVGQGILVALLAAAGALLTLRLSQ